jgi:hypothetical protein
MGVLKNLLTKKEDTNPEEIEVSTEKKLGYFDKAQQMADVVTVGLEQENYSDMNKQLSELVDNDTAKEVFVFEHQKNISTIVATIVFAVISVAFFYFLFIGLGTLIFSVKHILYALIGIIGSLAVIVCNSILIVRLVKTMKFKKRYDTYISLLKLGNFEIVEDLALYSNQPQQIVINDLNNAVNQKLIPQGHFSRENLVFMVSDEIYDKYMLNPAVYDRYFRQQIEDKNRIKDRTDEINEVIEKGNKYIEKIHDSNVIIKDKYVTRQLDKMETIVSTIFHEVDVNPSQADSLGMFLNYYLPTTEKLLDAYITIGEKQVTGKNLSKTQKEIEESLETIIVAFENILEKMYEAHEMDIASDIAAMEIMMKQEGLTTEE